MSYNFIPLDSDDVVLLGKSTFKVSILQELLDQEIKKKLHQHIYEDNSLEPGVSMLDFLSQISLGERKIDLKEIGYNYETDCQVLKIGDRSWQNGKLKIQIFISTVHYNQTQICLEFGCDDLSENGILLDEIAKIIQPEE